MTVEARHDIHDMKGRTLSRITSYQRKYFLPMGFTHQNLTPLQFLFFTFIT